MNILKDEHNICDKGPSLPSSPKSTSTKPFVVKQLNRNLKSTSKILISILIGLTCSFGTTIAGFACLSNPCIFGVCIDDLNSTYSCYCIDGYTGVQCQTNWDECWSSPCENGGTCIDGVAQYNCSCPEGFIGQNCEENLDECLSNPCQNGGTCNDKDNGYICTCALGYLGRHCENDVAVCETGNGTRCENGGECIEGPGLQFTCQCAPGWQGSNCVDEIDECASSPCQNGGICIDKLATYSCACAMGFTGSNCEETVLVCEDSPCENNALCLMEEGQPVCYCVPDFHGEKCEFQYDECQISPRCTNGGTCIDGVDDFSCSCPPSLTGILCECLVQVDGELDCNYTIPSTIPPLLTTMTTESSTTLISSTEFTTSSSSSSQPTTIKTDSTTYIDCRTYTPPTTVPTISTTEDEQTTETSTSSEKSSSSSSTSLFTTVDVSSTSQSSTSGTTTDTITTTSSSNEIDSTSTDAETTIMTTTLKSDDTSTATTFTPTSTTDDDAIDEETTTIFTIMPVHSSDATDKTTSTTTTTTYYSPSTTMASTTIAPFFTDFSTSGEPTLTPTRIPTTIYDDYSTITTSTFYSTSTITQDPLLFLSTTTTATTMTTTMSDGNDNVTGSPDCMRTPCYNGGTCLSTSEGSKCVCRFNRQGALCEEPLRIKNAAFAGDSYLSHRINPEDENEITFESQLTMQVEVRARTRATEGLIILAAAQGNRGGHYMALFLHRGLLQFQFSCGLQTMLLSELEAPVNTGNEMLIQVELDFSRNHSHCNASLRVNDTLAMSGDQPTWLSLQSNGRQTAKSIQNTWLHLGGAPQAPFGLMAELPGGQGFTGCLHDLKVNGKYKEIFSNAVDGYGITECGSLACLSNPCQNGAICIEDEHKNDVDDDDDDDNENNLIDKREQKQKHDKWKCKCPTGYMGLTCEISVCDNNPCQYGGTCVTFPGSGYLCLCPLGKHGHYCEHNLEIAQPSFSGSVKGLSSYVAYPVPVPLEYTLELSFKIQPTTISQIALLAFLGQTGYHDEKSDHLAISFIQGYIMLTWNLGGGPRRIFLQKPIEIKNDGQPHEIRIGRTGRKAWLSVDGKSNVTGRSPGALTRLDVMPMLYLGGHEHANFSTLPHDLPLHSGFQGCIFDVTLKSGLVTVPLQDTKGVRGRGVGQCGTRECHRYACQHEGACLQYGATFTCICQEGWYGPLCAQKSNLCDSFNNKCTSDSFCVPLVNSYECDCPTGKTGRDCDIELKSLSDISLSGRRSFVAVGWPNQERTNNSTMDNVITHQRYQSPKRALEFLRPKAVTNSIFFKFVNEMDKPIESTLERKSPQLSQSMMVKTPDQHNRIQSFSMEFQVRPLSERGLLIFFGSFEDNVEKPTLGFVSLSLQGGVVEFRIAGPENHLAVVRSSRILAIGEWHKIKISQNGKRIMLWVEGSTTQAVLQSGFIFVNLNEIIYLGGLPDLSKLPHNAVSGFPIPFRGCIRQFVVNGIRVVLNETNILDSRNILDCDGTACGGDSCDLGGHCWLDERLQPHCKCPQNSRGDRCEISESCNIVPCKNGGKCNSAGFCNCPNGWGGFYCEIATSKFSTPSFRGRSYIKIPPTRIPQKEKRAGPSLYIRPKDSIQIAFKFSTIHTDGLLLWGAKQHDTFLGLGIENGHLKLASSLLAVDNATVDIPAGGFVADGGWHNVIITINDDELVLNVDDRTIFSEKKRQVDLKTSDGIESVTLEDTFYLGGFPTTNSISSLTGNKFQKSYSGCLQDITFGDEPKLQIEDYTIYEGENIGSCELYDEFIDL